MDKILLIIIGVFIGIAITTCVIGKAMYDASKEMKDEDEK